MTISRNQQQLIETLERICRLEPENLEIYAVTVKGLEESPIEERSRDVLARMIRCIWDNSPMPDELNPIVKNLCRACQKYAFSLAKTKTDGYILGLEEVIKAASDVLPQSYNYFGMEMLLGYLKVLADDRQYKTFLNTVVWTLFSLPFGKCDTVMRFISNAADKAGREKGYSSQETVFGIILSRIMAANTLYRSQYELIRILENASRKMEAESDDDIYYAQMDTFFAAMTALEYSPREQHCREALARMIRCIIDGKDLNPMFSTLCRLCDSYALNLSENETEGYAIGLQEAIKAAPQRLPKSPVYFGGEYFQSYINLLYRDDDCHRYLPSAISAFRSLSHDEIDFVLSHIWNLGEKDGKYENVDPKETQYGLIHGRIKQGLKTG